MPASLLDHESELAQALRRLEGRTPYVEVMAERSSGSGVRVDRQTTTPRVQPHLSGAVFRAWDGVRWVETAASGLAKGAVTASVDALLPQLPGTSSAAPPGPSSELRGEARTEEKRPAADFGLEERLDWCGTRKEWALAVPGVKNIFVDLMSLSEERLFLNTAGARTYQSCQRCLASITPLAVENGRVEFDYLQLGGLGGFEIVDRADEAHVAHTAQEAVALLGAKPAPAGVMNVVLDSSTTGTFAHESFGHGTEADQIVRERSYLAPLLDQELGPEFLSIVDNGAYPGGWGSIFFDDEGWPAQRTVLVDHGRFVEVLHDRESAALLHRRPTGNVRRSDFLSRPFVRMTNTYVEPGDRKVEELIAETKEGVLMERFLNGIEDPMGGNMQLKVKKGRRIQNGELTDRYSSMALSGKVLDFLREIRGVSRPVDFDLAPGFCGKGHTDMLVTSTGGPYLASRAVVGPA